MVIQLIGGCKLIVNYSLNNCPRADYTSGNKQTARNRKKVYAHLPQFKGLRKSNICRFPKDTSGPIKDFKTEVVLVKCPVNECFCRFCGLHSENKRQKLKCETLAHWYEVNDPGFPIHHLPIAEA